MNARRILLCGCALVALAACSDLRESLGLGRTAPDEYTVIDRPPLSMPPDFGLRPPQPGAARPQETPVDKDVSETVLNSKAAPPADASASDSEKALLDQTGAA